MQCEECREHLLELIYEEGIRPRRRLELMNHVDGCPMCHEEYATLLESRALLQEWPDEEPAWSLRVDPGYGTARARGWLSFGPWCLSRPLLRRAALALLLLVALLAASQSRLTWTDGQLTLHARLWKSSGMAETAQGMNPQELLSTVDQMIAESEQRQNKLFGTALIKIWEDMEIRHRYEHGEIHTAFEGLQKQNEARWEMVRQPAR
ncbi:MAG: hypothetical protein HYX74_07195 [Acidobacteria bacterium]|nr:hypothetical protein [Acidobacteriota bacterium]